MKTLALAVVLAFGSSCATFGPPVTDIGVCTAGRIAGQVTEIRPQVANCLATGNYMACLNSIGKLVGQDVLVCAVREFTGVGAPGVTTNPVVNERARAFLATKKLKGAP